MTGRGEGPPKPKDSLELNRKWRLVISAAAGFLLVTAFPTFHFYFVAWVSIFFLLMAIWGARPRFAALCGYVYGAAFFTPSLTWLYATFLLHGGIGPFISCVALAAVVAMASVFPMLFTLSFAWIARRNVTLACMAAPFVWVAQEFGRTNVPGIGFPWNLLGYAATHSLALAQVTTFGGVWILSFLIVAFNALLFLALVHWRAGRYTTLYAATGAAVVLTLVIGFGDRMVPQAVPDHVARLVQSNFPEPDSFPADWLDTHAGELDELARLSTSPDARGNAPGLVVWSEVPAPFSMQEPKFAARAAAIGRGTRDGFLVGVVDWRVETGVGWHAHNSAALIDPSGRETFEYDKIHLVPFSEYLPYGNWFEFVRRITPEVGNFQPGTESKVGTLPDGRRFGVFICYEAAFPGGVQKFVANGAELLINISNDGWFGRSAAPEQHLDMARVRAIEERRWMVRCTNNGYTVSVDPYGREVARLATDVRAVLEAPYAYRNDMTFYARWGDWLPWMSLAAGMGFVIMGSFARKSER